MFPSYEWGLYWFAVGMVFDPVLQGMGWRPSSAFERLFAAMVWPASLVMILAWLVYRCTRKVYKSIIEKGVHAG